MKLKAISITFAILALLCGVVWLWSVLVVPIIRHWSEDPATRSYGFLFIILPMMSLPGILAVYFGVRLLNQSNEKNIRGAVGILMVLLTLRLSPLIQALFPRGADEESVRGVSFLVGTVIAVMLYLVLAKWVLRVTGFPVAGIREVISRVPLLLIAWQIWSVGSRLFAVYSPKKEGHKYVLPNEPWGLAGFLVPILAAWLFYKLSIKAFGIKKAEARPLNKVDDNKR